MEIGMNKTNCPKCKKEISNDFGVQLEFCTSCGFQLKEFTEAQTIVKPMYDQKLNSPKKSFNSKYLIGCLGVGFGLVLISVLGLFGYWWYSSENTLENPAYFGKISVPETQTIRYIGDEFYDPQTLDPHILYDYDIIPALFDGLVENSNNNADLTPSLAEKWESNSDASVWTFYLRKDTKWTDGKPITADDFVYSWKRLLSPELNSRVSFPLFSIKNAEEYASSKASAEDVSIKAIDDYTLQVTLKQPTPYFDKMIADDAFRPVPKQAIEKHGENWTKPENMVTSGAFKLSEWAVDKQIVLERNPQFWDNANTKLDKIIFPFLLKEDVENWKAILPAKLYKNGEIDATKRYLSEDETYENKKDFIRYNLDGTEFMHLNMQFKPLDDKRVRKAFNLVIDQQILKGMGISSRPTTSFVPEMKNYKNADVISYDPVEARKLLAEAGFPRGKGFPELEITYNPAERNKKVAEFVQARLKIELGITLQLKSIDWKDFFKLRENREYKGLARAGWVADYSDPFNFLELMSDKNNPSGWVNEKYNELLKKANLETDEAKRYQILAEAETLMLEDYPVIPISNSNPAFLCKPYVKNFSINPLGKINWREVYIDTDFTKEFLSSQEKK
jgi:oligopeptide transport system substrate-binding protein